jgi:hypothetical protein
VATHDAASAKNAQKQGASFKRGVRILLSLAYTRPSFMVVRKLSVADVTSVNPRTISIVNSNMQPG